MKKIENKKVKQRILLILLVVLIVILTVIIILFQIKNNKKEDNLVFEKFDSIGGNISENEYYIFGAKRDISFEVEKKDNFSYKIYDNNKKEVLVNTVDKDNILTINSPNNYYNYGEIYYLEIENGTFVNKEYGNAKMIIFSIERPAKQVLELNDGLIKVKEEDVSINGKIIKSKENFKVGDILLVDNDEKLKETYKITKKINNNDYEYQIPDIKEVFNDIDYYGMESINLSTFENDNDFNLLLISILKEKILNGLINTVNANENIEINKPVWNKKDNTLDVKITIDMPNNKEFLANHNSKIDLTLSLAIDLYRNITLDNYDYALRIKYKTKINSNLKHVDNEFNDFYNDIKNVEKIDNYNTTWLEEKYSEIKRDKVSVNKSLGKGIFNTKVPGLYLAIDLGILFDIDTKAIIDSDYNGESVLIIGVNSTLGTYNYHSENSVANINFVGNNKMKMGSNIKTELNFLNLFNLGTNMSCGMNNDGVSTISVDKRDNVVTDVNFIINGAVVTYNTYEYHTNFGEDKILYSNEQKINDFKKEIKLVKKQNEKQDEKKEENTDNNKVTYKYSADKVREMIQKGYDNLNSEEEWEIDMGTLLNDITIQKTINVNKNEFISVADYNHGAIIYTCVYDYVNDTMNCDNFSNAQNYIKGKCDVLYNEYLRYQQTGETEMEDAKEWEDLYGDINACYYDGIPKSEPKNFKSDIKKIIDNVGLTFDDLEVLKVG